MKRNADRFLQNSFFRQIGKSEITPWTTPPRIHTFSPCLLLLSYASSISAACGFLASTFSFDTTIRLQELRWFRHRLHRHRRLSIHQGDRFKSLPYWRNFSLVIFFGLRVYNKYHYIHWLHWLDGIFLLILSSSIAFGILPWYYILPCNYIQFLWYYNSIKCCSWFPLTLMIVRIVMY